MSAPAKRQPREVILHWLKTIKEEGTYLTGWEEGFVAGLSDRLDRGGWLNEKEEGILEKIYAEKTP